MFCLIETEILQMFKEKFFELDIYQYIVLYFRSLIKFAMKLLILP